MDPISLLAYLYNPNAFETGDVNKAANALEQLLREMATTKELRADVSLRAASAAEALKEFAKEASAAIPGRDAAANAELKRVRQEIETLNQQHASEIVELKKNHEENLATVMSELEGEINARNGDIATLEAELKAERAKTATSKASK